MQATTFVEGLAEFLSLPGDRSFITTTIKKCGIYCLVQKVK
jgi:hypothetical protein